MLDANCRPIEVGDHISLADADVGIIGRVIELFDDDKDNGFVALEDGLVFHDFEIESWGGFEWTRCQECNFTWPLDTRMNKVEECPDCGQLVID